MNPVPAASPAVKVINILRYQQEIAIKALLKVSQGNVGCIGSNSGQLPPALVIEGLHQGRVTIIAFRSGHILHRMVFPETIIGTEGTDTGFGRDTRTGQDNNRAKS